MERLNLEQADHIASNVVNCIKRNKFAPITVHVIDQSGDVLVTKRMDGCASKAIPEFAYAKAFTCIGMKQSSRMFRDKYTKGGDPAKFCQMTSMVNISGGNMAPFPGGVYMKTGNGQTLGAVGVSGAAGDEDEYCALRGVIEAGYGNIVTVPDQPSCSTVKDKF